VRTIFGRTLAGPSWPPNCAGTSCVACRRSAAEFVLPFSAAARPTQHTTTPVFESSWGPTVFRPKQLVHRNLTAPTSSHARSMHLEHDLLVHPGRHEPPPSPLLRAETRAACRSSSLVVGKAVPAYSGHPPLVPSANTMNHGPCMCVVRFMSSSRKSSCPRMSQ
jgi:hypothetical protein